MLRILLICVFSGLALVGVYAEQSNGPPEPHEILGHWKLIEWPVAEMNKVNPWPLKHQYFAFYDDGKYFSMMKSTSEPVEPDEMDKAYAVLSENSPNYSWRGNFLIISNKSIEGYNEIWGMNIMRVPDSRLPFSVGDLIMSLAGGPNGDPVYYRWLRRID